jgi:hypothetical protein
MMDSDMQKQTICWITVIMWAFQGTAYSIGNGEKLTPKLDSMEQQRPRTTEKFDLAYYRGKIREYNRTDDSFAIYTEPDGTQVRVFILDELYSVQTIDKKDLNSELKIYHKSLYLKEESTLMCLSNTVLIGMHREYDEQGYLIKETDEDRKFDGLYMKPADILRYLQRLGYINLKTGEGKERLDRSNEIEIFFTSKADWKSILGERKPALWSIEFYHNGRVTTHTINAETGEVMSIKEELMEE